jgi:hypothetical protein
MRGRGLRRVRGLPTVPAPHELTDENGQPITFANPGSPTPEERRAYAEAVQRATTSAPLTKEQQAAHDAAIQQRRERFPWKVNW